jgi:GNAT superfamily N-acetyltransferase
MEVAPVTDERWDDLVALFTRPGPRGGKPVTNGCWCMFWRREPAAFRRGWGGGNRAAMRRLVREGREPGLLAYADGEPVGWISIAPREEFVRLERSRVLKRVAERPVWSVVCFYLHRDWRRRGVGSALLRGALEYAREKGAEVVEAYGSKPTDEDPFTGLESIFLDAGFEVVRRGGRRSILRLAL